MIIGTQHCQAVERDLIDEFKEAFINAFHAPVVIQMFTVQVGNGDNGWRQP
jgi:hypothetical protein